MHPRNRLVLRWRLPFALTLCLFSLNATAVDLVKAGKPIASIVIPADPLPVESYAATELQYHVESATGAHLAIVHEGQAVDSPTRIYLGHVTSAATIGIDVSPLPGNACVFKTAGPDLYICGKDTPGDPLADDTRAGTLFGVYELLEDQLHVAWLWPGKLGEVIPRAADVSLTPPDATRTPLLWFKDWRHGKSTGERVWLRRHRFGRSTRPGYGHAFGNWWSRFGESHPEYFAMLPDGTRRLDPTSDRDPQYQHLCVSEPGVRDQIIADWKARGSPEFLNVCENDGWAGCACPRCLSWDQHDPTDTDVDFDHRLDAARAAFAHGRDWQLKLGSLSDRYARFWQSVADEAVKSNPNVKVISYVYDNYRKPPLKATLSNHVLCGMVPHAAYPYGKAESDLFRAEWLGWQRTGCQLFLRPNYTSQAPAFPAFYARAVGEDLKFALAHGCRATDFDSLDGHYAVQGPTLYVIAHVLDHPDTDVDATLQQFYAAFGPAEADVEAYFKLWESVYPQQTVEAFADRLHARRKYGAGTYGPFYVVAGEVYTPDVMRPAAALLATAADHAATTPVAAARVDWLARGFHHAELILATQRAYETAVDTGDRAPLKQAYAALLDYRAANADYDAAHFAGITVHNERPWKGAE